MYPSLSSFNTFHKDDMLVKPIDNKVTTEGGLITTTNASIIEHRSDKAEVVIGKGVYSKGDVVRYNLVYGLDIMFEEGHYILIETSKILGKETSD